MGFVGKIAKTTENPENKYKLLKYRYLYLIFRRFSILFVDLVGVHEILQHNISSLNSLMRKVPTVLYGQRKTWKHIINTSMMP